MRKIILAAAMVLSASISRADVALVLTDNERQAFIAMIGAVLQSNPGLSVQAVFLLNKINTAPVVTSTKEVKPEDSDKQEQPR